MNSYIKQSKLNFKPTNFGLIWFIIPLTNY